MPTHAVVSPLSNDIVRVVPSKHVEFPNLELFNRKGDPLTLIKSFQTWCSDFSHDQILLEKLFTRTLRGRALQWYFFFPFYSITYFQQLANAFIQIFHNNIGPKVTLTDVIHFKRGVKEKVSDFIVRYKHFYSQFLVPDQDIQNIFISNLQKDIRDKLLLIEFTSFLHLCVILYNYQLTMSQLDQSSPSMAPSDKGASSQQLFVKFKQTKDS